VLPQKCGSLPSDLRKADLSYSQFRRSLKTFIFGQPDHGALWTFLTALCRNIPAYLLTKKSRCFVVLIDVPLSANFAKKGGAGLVIFVGSGTAFGGPTSRDAPTLIVLWPVGHWWLPLCSLVIRRWSHVLVEAPVRPSLVARLLMALILIAAASARERERERESARESAGRLAASTPALPPRHGSSLLWRPQRRTWQKSDQSVLLLCATFRSEANHLLASPSKTTASEICHLDVDHEFYDKRKRFFFFFWQSYATKYTCSYETGHFTESASVLLLLLLLL